MSLAERFVADDFADHDRDDADGGGRVARKAIGIDDLSPCRSQRLVRAPDWPSSTLTELQSFERTLVAMAPASFSIELDPPRHLVRIRLCGFFSAADIARFQTELLLVHRRLGCGRRGQPLTINDISGMAIQSQDVVARWSAFLADPAHRSRRLAFVVASTLARMQLQRVIGGRDAKVFTDPTEAERWLFTDEVGDPA